MIEKLEKKFDSATFSKQVEELVKFHSMEYLEAIMHFGEQNGLEIEAIASLVKRSDPIKQKLEAQAREARVLGRGPVTATLDAFQESQ